MASVGTRTRGPASAARSGKTVARVSPDQAVLGDPHRNNQLEDQLSRKYHVTFTFSPEVPLTAFDAGRSVRNQARLEAINKDAAERYAEALRNDVVLPAVVARWHGSGSTRRLVIVDGNHRLEAHRLAERTTIPVYEVGEDTHPQTITLMTYSLNVGHGLPMSNEELIHHALHLVESGNTQESAAAAMGLKLSTVTREVKKREADRRAHDLAISPKVWNALGTTIKARLGDVRTDGGFQEAVSAAYQANLTGSAVNDLVTRLNQSKSEDKQEELARQVLVDNKHRVQASGGGQLRTSTGAKAGISPRAMVGMMIGHAEKLPTDAAIIRGLYPAAEVEDAIQGLRNVARIVTEFADVLDGE